MTSAFRSACSSFTHSSPRRALARQLIRRTRSPGTNCRRSANSIPSPFSRATRLPGEDLRLERRAGLLSRLGTRVDLDRELEVEAALVAARPKRSRATGRPRRRCTRPSARSESRYSSSRSPPRDPQRDGVLAVREREALREVEPRAAARSGRRSTVGASRPRPRSRAPARARARTPDRGVSASASPAPATQRERRREHDQLREARGRATRRGRGRVKPAYAPSAWRSSARQLNGGRLRRAASAPSPAPARTTSSELTRCTQSSGRSIRRCVSAGTATALTSSGVTKSRPSSAARQRDELEQRERAARARADLHARALTRRRDDVDHVVADRLGDVDLLRRALHVQQRRAVDDGARAPPRPPCARRAARASPTRGAVRVADRRPQEEAVELRLRQRIRALVLDRVLGGDDEERAARAGACGPRS